MSNAAVNAFITNNQLPPSAFSTDIVSKAVNNGLGTKKPNYTVPHNFGLPEVKMGRTSGVNNRLGQDSVLSVNARAIFGYGINRALTFDHWHSTGQICFISKTHDTRSDWDRAYQICGLSILNWKLKNDINFASKFDYHSGHSFMEHWRLLGIRQPLDHNLKTEHDPVIFNSFVVAGKADLPNYWAGLKSYRNSNATVRELDSLWLLLRRYRRVTRKRTANGDVPGKGNQTAISDHTQYYWQLVPHATSSKAPPPLDLYSTPDVKDSTGKIIREGYYGACMRIGTVNYLYQDDTIKSARFRDKASNAICPEYDTSAYINDFQELPRIEIRFRA